VNGTTLPQIDQAGQLFLPSPRPLLPHIPERQRGPLINRFLDPVRTRGIIDATEIVKCVVAGLQQALQRRGRWNTVSDLGTLRDTLLVVLAHPTEALTLAAEAVVYEHLPPSEKAEFKEIRRVSGRQAHMAHLPPTEKQLQYLRRLGVVAVPANRLDASKLIDACVRGGVEQ
jgi:hypothetical protein